MNQIETIEALHNQGYIKYIDYNEPKLTTIKADFPVRGNENRALNLFQALLDISKIIPDCKIIMWDEGKFLYSSEIIIRQGKVLPKLDFQKEQIRKLAASILLHSDISSKNGMFQKVLDKCFDEDTIFDLFGHTIKSETSLALKHLFTGLFEYAFIAQKLREAYGKNYYTKIRSLINNIHKYSEVNEWLTPENWHRDLNSEESDNLNLVYGCLNGFLGEAYGLDPNNFDPNKEENQFLNNFKIALQKIWDDQNS